MGSDYLRNEFPAAVGIKDCPFCGGPAVLKIYVIEASIVCQTCKASITRKHSATDNNGDSKALKAWNARDKRC